MTPVALSHDTIKDDVYNNMLMVLFWPTFSRSNSHLRDHSEPKIFNPTQYLPISEGENDEPFPDSPQFGYGRR
jgi:hypothetical protein